MILSIITISFNSEKTIEQTIRSIIDQKTEDVEYIIIDGGSTDKTLEIVSRYKEKLDVVISEKDKGISDAFNKGIRNAQGDIIGIINSDDLLHEGAVKTILAEFKQDPDIDVLYGNLQVFDNDIHSGYEVKSDTDLSKLRYAFLMPHPCVFIKKCAYDRYGMYSLDCKNAMDYELISRMYYGGAKFKYVDRVLADFRAGGQSQSSFNVTMQEHRAISKRNGSKLWEREKYIFYAKMREIIRPFLKFIRIESRLRQSVRVNRERKQKKKR